MSRNNLSADRAFRRFPPAFIFLLMTWFGLQTCMAQLKLSPLAEERPWRTLDRFQETITKEVFLELLGKRYSVDGSFLKYCLLDDVGVDFFQEEERETPLWRLNFGTLQPTKRPRSDTEKPSPAFPLSGLVIALDPGHIGGRWARVEQRFMQMGNDPAIIEWDLNYLTCLHIAAGLRAKGAKVVWTKEKPEPTSPLPIERFYPEVMAALFQENLRKGFGRTWDAPDLIQLRIRQRAEGLFARTVEIRARATLLNEVLQPDLTLCVHYNAAPWGDPLKPALVDQSRLVLFTHGAYLAEELQFEDVKYDLMFKLLERAQTEEEEIAVSVAQQYAEIWPYPPVEYKEANTIASKKSRYVYARNLLANRLFHGPVVYCEGPYMNGRDAYPRLVAGDYQGTKMVDGKLQRSLFREYAEAVVNGVVTHYEKKNGPLPQGGGP